MKIYQREDSVVRCPPWEWKGTVWEKTGHKDSLAKNHSSVGWKILPLKSHMLWNVQGEIVSVGSWLSKAWNWCLGLFRKVLGHLDSQRSEQSCTRRRASVQALNQNHPLPPLPSPWLRVLAPNLPLHCRLIKAFPSAETLHFGDWWSVWYFPLCVSRAFTVGVRMLCRSEEALWSVCGRGHMCRQDVPPPQPQGSCSALSQHHVTMNNTA